MTDLSIKSVESEEGATVYEIAGFSLPTTQNYAPYSFGNGAFPMAAVSDDHNLKFKNILGVIKFSLTGSIVVQSIKLEGNNGEKLSGAATLTLCADNTNPKVEMSPSAATEVTLSCGAGVQLNSISTTDFYIAVPPVTFEKGFKVTVMDSNGVRYTIPATAANTVYRSSILMEHRIILVLLTLESLGMITHKVSSRFREQIGISGSFNGWNDEVVMQFHIATQRSFHLIPNQSRNRNLVIMVGV